MRYDKKKYLYENIESKLLDKINEMEIDEKLPSRNILANEYNVTRSTIDRAIAQLISKRYLASQRGSGTYKIRRIMNESSNYIGIILPNIVHNGYPEIIKGVEEEARRNNLNIILCTTESEDTKLLEHINNLISSNVLGIIIIPNIKLSLDLEWLSKLENSGIPYVFCNRQIENVNAPAVLLNNFHAAYIATKHLINTNCKNIAFISYPIYSAIRERYQGYLSCLIENNMQSCEYLYIEEEYEKEEEDIKGIQYLLSHNENIDAIICSDDKSAYNCIKYLLKIGYEVPNQISIIGFDNSFICDNPYVNITSIDFKYYDMGVRACKILLEKNIEKFKDMLLCVPELIVRDSSS